MGEATPQLLHLVRRLAREDTHSFFGEPVATKWTLLAKEYLARITHPMDLGTISDKLQNNQYTNPEQVVDDIRLTFNNAKTFNPPGDPCYVEADRLLDFFKQLYQELEAKLERAAQKAAQKSKTQVAAPIPITSEFKSELLRLIELLRAHPWPAPASQTAPQQAEAIKKKLMANGYATNVELASAVDKMFVYSKQAVEESSTSKRKKLDINSLKSMQQKYRKFLEDVYQTSPTMRKLSMILDLLFSDPRSFVFQPPVNFSDYPTYKEVVQTPMNLDKVRTNLQQGMYEPPNEIKFFQDVQLVWDNCKKFNADGSAIYIQAEECEKKFKSLIKEHYGPLPTSLTSSASSSSSSSSAAASVSSSVPSPSITKLEKKAKTTPISVTDSEVKKVKTEKKKAKQNGVPTPSPSPSFASAPSTPTPLSTRTHASSASASATASSSSSSAVSAAYPLVKYSRKLANRILKKVKNLDVDLLFMNEVTDEIAPQYSRIITQPMWLGKIEEKIGSDAYSSLDRFHEDFKLMWRNCAIYNVNGPVFDSGVRMNQGFDKIWKKAMKKATKNAELKVEQQQQPSSSSSSSIITLTPSSSSRTASSSALPPVKLPPPSIAIAAEEDDEEEDCIDVLGDDPPASSASSVSSVTSATPSTTSSTTTSSTAFSAASTPSTSTSASRSSSTTTSSAVSASTSSSRSASTTTTASRSASTTSISTATRSVPSTSTAARSTAVATSTSTSTSSRSTVATITSTSATSSRSTTTAFTTAISTTATSSRPASTSAAPRSTSISSTSSTPFSSSTSTSTTVSSTAVTGTSTATPSTSSSSSSTTSTVVAATASTTLASTSSTSFRSAPVAAVASVPSHIATNISSVTSVVVPSPIDILSSPVRNDSNSKEEEGDDDLVIDIMSLPTPTKAPNVLKLPRTPVPLSPTRTNQKNLPLPSAAATLFPAPSSSTTTAAVSATINDTSIISVTDDDDAASSSSSTSAPASSMSISMSVFSPSTTTTSTAAVTNISNGVSTLSLSSSSSSTLPVLSTPAKSVKHVPSFHRPAPPSTRQSTSAPSSTPTQTPVKDEVKKAARKSVVIIPTGEGNEEDDEEIDPEGWIDIIEQLIKDKRFHIFILPVDVVAFPSYQEIVTNPMDLTTLKQKIEKGEITTNVEFQNKMSTIWKNCFLFNPAETEEHAAGVKLMQKFQTLWKNLAHDTSRMNKCARLFETFLSAYPKHVLPFDCVLEPKAQGLDGYEEKVEKVMDFVKVRENLAHNKYANPRSFASDVRLVFENCVLYHGKENLLSLQAQYLLNEFNLRFKETFAKKNKRKGKTKRVIYVKNGAEQRLSSGDEKRCRAMLIEINDRYYAFSIPVDPASFEPPLSDYYVVIDKPMDFKTIERKLSISLYSTCEEFYSDIVQIYTNVFKYYGPKIEQKKGSPEDLEVYKALISQAKEMQNSFQGLRQQPSIRPRAAITHTPVSSAPLLSLPSSSSSSSATTVTAPTTATATTAAIASISATATAATTSTAAPIYLLPKPTGPPSRPRPSFLPPPIAGQPAASLFLTPVPYTPSTSTTTSSTAAINTATDTKTISEKENISSSNSNSSHAHRLDVASSTSSSSKDDTPSGETMILSLPIQQTARKKSLKDKLAHKKFLHDNLSHHQKSLIQTTPTMNANTLHHSNNVSSSHQQLLHNRQLALLQKKKRKRKSLSCHERTALLHKALNHFARPPPSPAALIQAVMPVFLSPQVDAPPPPLLPTPSSSVSFGVPSSVTTVSSSSLLSSIANTTTSAPLLLSSSTSPTHTLSETSIQPRKASNLALTWKKTRRVLAKRPLESPPSPTNEVAVWPEVSAQPPRKAPKIIREKAPSSMDLQVNVGPLPLENLERFGFEEPDEHDIVVKCRRQFLTFSSLQIEHTAVLLARSKVSKFPVEVSLSTSPITAAQWEDLNRLGGLLRTTEGHCEVESLRWLSSGLLYSIQPFTLPEPGDCVLLRLFSHVGTLQIVINNHPYASVFDPQMPWALTLLLRPSPPPLAIPTT